MNWQPPGYSQNVTTSICVLALILYSVPCRPKASASPACAKTRAPYGTAPILASHVSITRNLLHSRSNALVST